MSAERDSESESIAVDTITTVKVPRSKLSKDMSDEELRRAVIWHGSPDAVHELAQGIEPIRDKLEGDS